MVEFEEKKTKLVKLLTSLGEIQMEQGNFDDAIKYYEKIIGLGFEEPVVYSSLSKAFMQLERVDTKALNIYRKTLTYDPRNLEVCDWLSQHYLRMNRRDEEAVEIYSRALRLKSVLAGELLPTLIHVHLEQNDVAQATEVAQMGMDFPEFREEAINYYLQLTFRHQQHERSLKVLRAYYKRTREPDFLKAICQVMLDRQATLANSGERLYFTEEECDLALRLLAGKISLTQFEDLQFYVALSNQVSHSRELQTHSKDEIIGEYEFFFTNQEPEVVLKRGFHGDASEDKSQTNYFISYWNSLSNAFAGEKAENTAQSLLKKKRCLLGFAVQIVNFRALLLQHGLTRAQKIAGNLVTHLMPFLRKNEKFQVRFLADGVLILAPFHPSMLYNTIEILREAEKHEFKNPESEQCRIFASLHLIDFDEEKPDVALDQLNFLLNLNYSFRIQQTGEASENFTAENQLFISQSLFDEITELESIQIRPFDKRQIKHYAKKYSLYQVEWADPLERFKAGMLQQLGRFEIVNELGKFPVYSVYNGRDNLLERIVLIKTVRKIKARFRESEKTPLAIRFFEESRQMGSLNHRNIITIYDVGQEPGFIYLAREYFEGINLKLLSRKENLDTNRIIRIFIQICSALKYAHQMEIFHKNLKPNNIILSNLDEVKVTDFGEMNYYLKTFESNGEYVSDLAYLPPEQILEETTDGRADIYALGIMLYEVLYGEVPFWADNSEELKQQILNYTPDLAPETDREIHPGFHEILNCALAKDASSRYQSIQEMIKDFYVVLRQS